MDLTESSTTPQSLRSQILQALNGGKIAFAKTLARELVERTDTTFNDCLSAVQMGQRQADKELASFALTRAVLIAPPHARVLADLAQQAMDICFTGPALAALSRGAQLCASPDDYRRIGESYERVFEIQSAFDVYARGVEAFPDNMDLRYRLALMHAYSGDIEVAEPLFDDCVVAGASLSGAYWSRSWLRTQTIDDNHIEELLARLKAGPLPAELEISLQFALGKEYEDIGDVDRSFAHYKAGANRQRRDVAAATGYRIEAHVHEADEIRRTFDDAWFAKERRGNPSTEPIFIVGMPRSGSTLVERFLASHSKILAAGELETFHRLTALRAGRMVRREKTFLPSLYSGLDTLDLGTSYLEGTRPRTGHTPYFIDKLPTNFLLCGLISRALPNARIVHVHRHPMDACFAMFKQIFQMGYEFTYDLVDLGKKYVAYRALMDHWDRMMPGQIIHVAYEDLVADPGPVVRDLVKRLGLDWQDVCLDHRISRDASTTASATQVRQPIYQSSVGKWRQYEKHLAPLRDALEAGGIQIA